MVYLYRKKNEFGEWYIIKVKKRLTVITTLIIITLIIVAVFNHFESKNKTNVITMKDLNGEINTLSFTDNKPSVLLFFTSWCPYCNEDAPKIVSMYEKYKDKINIYGINLIHRDDIDDVKDYINKYNIEYPTLLDEEGKLYKEYGSPGFPTLLFLDKQGFITRRIVGSTDINNIEKSFINSIKSSSVRLASGKEN